MGAQKLLSPLPTYSEELGLDLHRPEDRFKWFLASILFAKRISAQIAGKTYRRFEEEELTTQDRILEAGWDRLVQVLDSGGYVRYDFSTASRLLEIMRELKVRYGDLEALYKESTSPSDLERRLQEFKGVGPVCVNIFLRELRGIWKNAQPKPSNIAVEVAQRINIDRIDPCESALVRVGLEYCKKQKCADCPVGRYCKEKNSTWQDR